MTSSTKADWLLPAWLIALSVIPIAAGTFRVVQLGGSVEITPDNARFLAAPLPVVLPIVTGSYCAMYACSQPLRKIEYETSIQVSYIAADSTL